MLRAGEGKCLINLCTQRAVKRELDAEFKLDFCLDQTSFI